MKSNWECYVCGIERSFEIAVSGFLGNYHPLCKRCADKVLYDDNHRDRFRLTFHYAIGEVQIIGDVAVSTNLYNLN